MSDNHDYLGVTNPRMRLMGDVGMLMLKGAGYAMVFCLVTWFSLWAIFAVGKLLPPESQEADDPTPFSMMVPASEALQQV